MTFIPFLNEVEEVAITNTVLPHDEPTRKLMFSTEERERVNFNK